MPANDAARFDLEAKLLALLGQPTRLKLLQLLREGETCACEITPALPEDPSVVSRHLSKLHEMGLLSRRKQGVSVYYSIAEPRLFELLELTDEILRALAERRAQELANAF